MAAGLHVRLLGTSMEQQTSSHFLCMRTQHTRLSKNVISKHTGMHAIELQLLLWLFRGTRGTSTTEDREEKSSKIEMSYSTGGKMGNYSKVLLGVPQWTRTLSTGQECNCMSHLFLSRNAKGDFLLKPWPSAKKVLCSNIHATVHGQLPPHTHIPLHSMKRKKTKNKTTLNGWSCGFQFQFTLLTFKPFSENKKKKKPSMNCYGNKLMFWDYSFHYRKWPIRKLYTENGHTRFPYQTLLILVRSSLPSPVAKPDPKCHTFPWQPLPICPRAELPWEQLPSPTAPLQ